ncbi:hypothetical protein D3C86_1826850 [compost metagenome]
MGFDGLSLNGADGGRGLAAPGGYSGGDAVDDLVGQLALHAADHGGEFAGVDE